MTGDWKVLIMKWDRWGRLVLRSRVARKMQLPTKSESRLDDVAIYHMKTTLTCSPAFARHHRLSLALAFLGTLGGASLAQEAPAAKLPSSSWKSKPDVVVYRGTYPGWPWVARTPGGRLVCVWREGERHVFSAAGKLMLSTSDDQGRAWSKPRTFYDEPGIDDRNVAILALSDTDWLVAFNTYTADNKSRVFTLRTADGGQSWCKPQLICDFDARTRAAPLKLSTGELVLPFYREPNLQSFAAVSRDDGKNWQLVEIENQEGFLGDEWDACELPDGRLVGIIRNSAPKNDGTFYKTESRDRGHTWTRPVRTNLRDTRSTSPAQIFLHQGRPVVLYADARMVSVAMAVSDDPQLIQWQVNDRFSCYQYREDGRPIADSSYPVSVPVGGNRRFIVDYQHDGDEHLVTGYFVDLPPTWNRKSQK